MKQTNKENMNTPCKKCNDLGKSCCEEHSGKLTNQNQPTNKGGMDKQVLINLNKKIDGLEAQVKELSKYKEMWRDSQILIEQLHKQLKIKRDVLRVVVKKDDVPYLVRLEKVVDTSEGMIIEGEL